MMELTKIITIMSFFYILTSGHDISMDRIQTIPVESFMLDREQCRKNAITSARLSEVRNLFEKYNIAAYIITSDDVHMHPGGGDISPHDKRLQAVSGFSKNFGIGVVTKTNAALWTDGRKFNDAVNETDCGWEIYRKGGPDVITVTEWIVNKLSSTTGNTKIGVCPSYINAVWWKNFDRIFGLANIKLLPIEHDLVDQVWTVNRPLLSLKDINVLDIKFAGQSWQEKVDQVRKEMTLRNVDALVVTGVDEIAWLFNIRGKDFPYKPYFYSFAIVENEKISLYIVDSLSKLSRVPTDPESRLKLKDHFETGSDGRCNSNCVQVLEYNLDAVVQDIRRISEKPEVGKIWVSFDCNYRIYSTIPKSKVYQAIPPTLYLKAKKNFIERKGMRNSNLLDSVEIVEFFARLEKEVSNGVSWTVHSAAEEAIKVRSRSLSFYRDQSFNTLSGSGPKGADFGYHPTEETDHPITTTEIFNQDSGGQYLDGTSDLTRTFHYGTPTQHEKEMYTRVLMAHINLSKLKFPKGKTGREIDVVSREPLWEIGKDYKHETGHGISHNGAVVEGPARISCVDETHTSDVKLEESLFGGEKSQLDKVPDWADYPIDEHMCFTTEPGYYDEGAFGIRLENVMIVRNVENKSNHPLTNFLEFETVTFIPYEPNLINYDLLSQSQVEWMNTYHESVWNKISPFLKKKNNVDALNWLHKRIQPVNLHYSLHSTYDKDLKIEL